MTRRRRKRRTVRSGYPAAVPKKQPKPQTSDLEYKKLVVWQRILILLILAVVAVLLSLIFVGGASVWVVIAVIVVLTVLMLVVIGAPQLLPKILYELARIFGLKPK
ncbi:MAG: hypothetical protein KDJ52_13680 [Anaerolineae bacterium]|nr:hypothetical protein [Anaerolineae bacterium]